MIQVREIEIRRAEGPTWTLEDITVGSFREANQKLFDASQTAPETGGYNKVDFTITFEDGETYEGRYDLKHWSVEVPDLRKHVVTHLEVLAGYTVPAWMSEKIYDEMMERNEREGFARQARDFLDTYAVKGA